MVVISENVLRHILRRHRDLTRLMGVKSVEELKEILTNVVEAPDEVHVDLLNVKYFLKKIDALYLNVIVVNDAVKTAYLISSKTYNRLREKRWVQHLC